MSESPDSSTAPAVPAALPRNGAAERDWRLPFSMGITLLWLLLGILYLSWIEGWSQFLGQGAPSVGGFLEGAFAPLAFLWLVVGFFLQQKQLTENTATIQAQLVEMRRTAMHAETQARAISADELHSRQDTFTRVAELVAQQLGTITGYLISSFLPERQGPEGVERIGELWESLGKGDTGAFSRQIVALVYRDDTDPVDLFWGSEIRSRHSRRFIEVFERLLRHAERCDPDHLIADALRDGMHGRTYRFMLETRPGGAGSS
ncbi:MAG: hypothetical protein QNK05_11470 [Myxococcota bacterium]|nr:hypothetical protein [Myxococcota bacterium]